MIILTVLRAVGAFLAALPGALKDAQQLRRDLHRQYPFVEF